MLLYTIYIRLEIKDIFKGYCETDFAGYEDLCLDIAGDSPMYSMIRRSATPEACPLHGPHTFSYTKVQFWFGK